MNYIEAKAKKNIYFFIGFLLFISSSGILLLTILKGFYILSVNISAQDFFSGLYANIGSSILSLYYQPFFPRFLWGITPSVNITDFLNVENWPLVVMFSVMFVSVFLISAASELSLRIKKVKEMVENEKLAASLRGESLEKFKEREKNIPVTKEGVFSKFHSLYFAPLIVGVVLYFLGKI